MREPDGSDDELYGPQVGKITRIEHIGTDRHRLDSFSYDLAVQPRDGLRRLSASLLPLSQDVRLREHAARRHLAACAVSAQRLGADAACAARAGVEASIAVLSRQRRLRHAQRRLRVRSCRAGRARAFRPTTLRKPGNSNVGHEGKRYGTELSAERQGCVGRIHEDVLGVKRWPLRTSRVGTGKRSLAVAVDIGRRVRLLRLVQVLSRGTAGSVDHRDAGDALPLWLDRRRARCRNSVLDLLCVAADFSGEAARAGRLCVARRVVGAGQRAADRLHQENDRISARGQQLRGVPHDQLSRGDRTRTRCS